MNSYHLFRKNLKHSKVILMPKNNISTFGTTTYNYYFLGKVNEESTHICEGNINVSNPLFITPYSDERMVQGFSLKMKEHFNQFLKELKVSNQILVDYRFENISRHSWEEKTAISEVLSEIKNNCKNNPMTTILIGRKSYWEPSLMKFCLKIIERSLPSNLNEIDEKGFLNEHGIPSKMLVEIEKLFNLANKNPKRISTLGNFLVEHDLFELYEERFFALMKKVKLKK